MTIVGFIALLPWALVLACCWLAWQLLRQNGRLLLRLDTVEQRLAEITVQPIPAPGTTRPPSGLPLGAPAPDFRLANMAGEEKALSEWRGRPVLLVFFDPRCGFCRQMAPNLAALEPDPMDGRPTPLVVSGRTVEENRELVDQHGLRCTLLIQDDGEVAGRYQARGTPMGYLIDEQGRIASELALGAPALLALADPAHKPRASDARPTLAGNGQPLQSSQERQRGNRPLAESRLNRTGLVAGEDAPGFRLPRLDGGELSLDDLRGRPVLLVFSDPHCGPCDELAPRLQRAGRTSPGIQIVMVSRGELEANRAKAAKFGLTFPILLQRQWEISKLYGMFGTPIAFLIDEEGKVAAGVATGVEPILALMKRGCPQSPDKIAPILRAEAVEAA